MPDVVLYRPPLVTSKCAGYRVRGLFTEPEEVFGEILIHAGPMAPYPLRMSHGEQRKSRVLALDLLHVPFAASRYQV